MNTLHDVLAEAAAHIDTPQRPASARFDYDEWLTKLASTAAGEGSAGGEGQLAVQQMIAMSHEAAAQEERLSAPSCVAGAPPAPHATLRAPVPQPPQPPQLPQPEFTAGPPLPPASSPPLPHTSRQYTSGGDPPAATHVELVAELRVAQADLSAEQEARRAQALEVASLRRQLEYASHELNQLRSSYARLESEAGDARAAEESQRVELREGAARGSRDGAVIRSLQQREAALLAQVTAVLQERDAATAAAQAHRADAEAVRKSYDELQRAQQDERQQMRALVRENANLRVDAGRHKAAAEAPRRHAAAAAASECAPACHMAGAAPLHRPRAPHPTSAPSSPPAVPSSPPPALPPAPPPPPPPLPAAPADGSAGVLAAASPAPKRGGRVLDFEGTPPRASPAAAERAQYETSITPPLPPAIPEPAAHTAAIAPLAQAGAAHDAGRLFTAGIRGGDGAPRRTSRRGAPAVRQPSFNLFSGEPLARSAGEAELAAPMANLRWERGCACRSAAEPLAEPPPPYPTDVAPFAVDDALSQRSHDAIAPLERQLMLLAVQKDRLEAEYARLPLSAGRTVAERRNKQMVEERLDELSKQMGSLRVQLRPLRAMRR